MHQTGQRRHIEDLAQQDEEAAETWKKPKSCLTNQWRTRMEPCSQIKVTKWLSNGSRSISERCSIIQHQWLSCSQNPTWYGYKAPNKTKDQTRHQAAESRSSRSWWTSRILQNNNRNVEYSRWEIFSTDDPLFYSIFISSLNARIELRENWTPAQNGRLAKVGGWGGKDQEK